MKKINGFMFILLFTCFYKAGSAQVESIPYYSNLNFENTFFVIAESDEKSNYYAVDLTVFKSTEEIRYFEKIAFEETKIVRLDAGNQQVAWFKAKKIHSEKDINTLLLNLKDRTVRSFSEMSESQKQDWLIQNKK
jgi:hypothetical protein